MSSCSFSAYTSAPLSSSALTNSSSSAVALPSVSALISSTLAAVVYSSRLIVIVISFFLRIFSLVVVLFVFIGIFLLRDFSLPCYYRSLFFLLLRT